MIKKYNWWTLVFKAALYVRMGFVGINNPEQQKESL